MKASCLPRISRLALAVSTGLVSLGVHAATIQVINSDDSGPGSLRWAVEVANNNADPSNEIEFSPATLGQTIQLSSPISISKTLTITGNGTTSTIVDGNGVTNLFNIDLGVGRVEMSQVTLAGGHNSGTGGGAIDSQADELYLSSIRLVGNVSYGQGGAVRHSPLVYDSLLHLRLCEISNNEVVGETNANRGGGIHADMWRPGDQVLIEDCEINDNSANHGAGVSILVPTTAFDDNQRTTISNSVITGNIAAQKGGGVLVDAYSPHFLSITTSDVSQNRARIGAGINTNSSSVINQSLISGNRSTCRGPGVLWQVQYYMSASTVWEINNSTISGNIGNSFPGIPEGCGNAGLGLHIQSEEGANAPAVFALRHTTLAFNTSEFQLDGIFGVGIWNRTGWPLLLDHSIAADNRLVGKVSNADLRGPLEARWSLLGTLTHFETPVVEGAGVQYVTSAALFPLADNGGRTRTHKIRRDSPARNAGDPDFSPPPVLDQRADANFPRVANGRIDIGAFESQLDILFSTGFRNYLQSSE